MLISMDHFWKITFEISSSIERFTGGRLLALKFDKEKITKLSSEVFDALAKLRELSDLPRTDLECLKTMY